MNKKTGIVLFICIIVICGAVVASFTVLKLDSKDDNVDVNNTTNVTENITNVTEEVNSSQSQNSGAYGYCAICGVPLSASEASDDYTQGKVCGNCAKNPYYYTDEGSQYANQKLEEAYSEDYNGVSNGSY